MGLAARARRQQTSLAAGRDQRSSTLNGSPSLVAGVVGRTGHRARCLVAEQTPADLFRKKSNRWLSRARRSRARRPTERHRRQRAERELTRLVRAQRRGERRPADPAAEWTTPPVEQFQCQRCRRPSTVLWRAGRWPRWLSPTSSARRRSAEIDALAALVSEPTDREGDAPLAVRNDAPPDRDGSPMVCGPVEFLDGQPVPQAFLDSVSIPKPSMWWAMCSPATASRCGPGRRHRLATVHQWPALIARDRGCVGLRGRPRLHPGPPHRSTGTIGWPKRHRQPRTEMPHRSCVGAPGVPSGSKIQTTGRMRAAADRLLAGIEEARLRLGAGLAWPRGGGVMPRWA